MKNLPAPKSGASVPPKLEKESETERVQIVAPRSWIRMIDEWRRQQDEIPNRSEAIRRLVESALEKPRARR